MVTALKDRAQLDAIDRVPVNRQCPHCNGRLYLDYDLLFTEDKCLNCGRSIATWYNNNTSFNIPSCIHNVYPMYHYAYLMYTQ